MNSPRFDGIVAPFPKPPPQIRGAYRAFDNAALLIADDPSRLSSFSDLPRPWIPASCKPELRRELWTWLDRVVIWLNHEYVFDPGHAIPACWPQHPHLAHEIAVLADLRFRAELAVTSEPLERWHTTNLPQFIQRMHLRVGEVCEGGHPTQWPAVARFDRHVGPEATVGRDARFENDAK